MGRRPSEEEPFEIDGVEYGPYSASRSPVEEFRVGDRIGQRSNTLLITRSEQSQNDPDYWELDWVRDDGSINNWEGPKHVTDFRWVQTLYVIQEADL